MHTPIVSNRSGKRFTPLHAVFASMLALFKQISAYCANYLHQTSADPVVLRNGPAQSAEKSKQWLYLSSCSVTEESFPDWQETTGDVVISTGYYALRNTFLKISVIRPTIQMSDSKMPTSIIVRLITGGIDVDTNRYTPSKLMTIAAIHSIAIVFGFIVVLGYN